MKREATHRTTPPPATQATLGVIGELGLSHTHWPTDTGLRVVNTQHTVQVCYEYTWILGNVSPRKFLFPFIFFHFIYLYLGRGKGERKGEKQQCVVASHMPPTRDLACNPGMSTDWESTSDPLLHRLASTQSTEPHQPGLHLFKKKKMHSAILCIWLENLIK